MVVDFGAVSAFGATVEFEDAGFAVASVVDVVPAAFVAVVAEYAVVGVAAFCGAVVCGIIGMAAFVGIGDLFNPVAYEEVGPAFTALLLMVAFLVFSSSPSLSEPPQALMARRENAVK